jgi:hypothetical protein
MSSATKAFTTSLIVVEKGVVGGGWRGFIFIANLGCRPVGGGRRISAKLGIFFWFGL